ncbi:uncharacterized protein LOC124356848 [Homalodisca vitripennis]|uniref:uncharacterized protein LOC124356848 n=1 Tax=Homalodisca vitripennis TaxID=197043 RepID=UPI001EEA29FA|nr:uncharacterized protein LOC124356848 [Homalodisca vitripennis]
MGIGVCVTTEGYWLVFIIVFFSINFGDTQLLINVKNQGGDVLQETISANVSDDAVMLEFQRSDGTLVTQLVDFKHASLSPTYLSVLSGCFYNLLQYNQLVKLLASIVYLGQEAKKPLIALNYKRIFVLASRVPGYLG